MIKLSSLIEQQSINESIYDKGIFKAIFFSGLPGAGKSYTISKITDGNIQPRIVNFDKYAEFIGKKYNIKDVGTEEFPFIDQSKMMTISQLSMYINSMLPLFIDTTSNKINRTLMRDGILKSFGYDTGMIWINTSIEVAIERMKKRDRSVPINFIKMVYKKQNENIEYYKNHFRDMFIEIHNSEGELTNSTILSAYRKVSSFFNSEVNNPIGKRYYKKSYDSTGYLIPNSFKSLGEIKSRLSNWY